MIEEIMEFLKVSDLSYEEKGNGKWEIILPDIVRASKVQGILDKDTDYYEQGDDEELSEDKLTLCYASDEFNITIIEDFKNEVYKIEIEELK